MKSDTLCSTTYLQRYMPDNPQGTALRNAMFVLFLEGPGQKHLVKERLKGADARARTVAETSESEYPASTVASVRGRDANNDCAPVKTVGAASSHSLEGGNPRCLERSGSDASSRRERRSQYLCLL